MGLLPYNSPGGEGWKDGQTEPEPGCMTDRLNPREGERKAEVSGDRWLGVAHKNLSSNSVEVQPQNPHGTLSSSDKLQQGFWASLGRPHCGRQSK